MRILRVSTICVLLAACCLALSFSAAADHKVLFEKARYAMETQGDLNQAIKLFNDIIKKYPKEREYAAKSQLYIGLCFEKLGARDAQKAYQAVLDKYQDQADTVKLARQRLAGLGQPAAASARCCDTTPVREENRDVPRPGSCRQSGCNRDIESGAESVSVFPWAGQAWQVYF